MKRALVLVGIAIGLLPTTLVVVFTGRSEPVVGNILQVEAREAECVQFAHMTFVRGETTDANNPVAAVAELGGMEIGPGLDAAVTSASGLVQTVLGEGDVVLEQIENGRTVAAYHAIDLGANQWAVTEYEYSGPCSLH